MGSGLTADFDADVFGVGEDVFADFDFDGGERVGLEQCLRDFLGEASIAHPC